MISAEDIEAFTPEQMEAVKILDEVAARMKAGTPRFMEASAAEFPQIIRAALLWRDVAIALWENQVEASRLVTASMAVFDRHGQEVN